MGDEVSGTTLDDVSGWIVTDMDHSLIRSDVTVECILKFVGSNPFNVFLFIAWLLRGRAYMKARLAERAMPEVATIPINDEVLEFLKQGQARGARLALASASNEEVVGAVADRIGIFDEVIGSNSSNNMKGVQKAQRLNERFGREQYAYIGDSVSDLKVWKDANRAITVGASNGLRKRVESISDSVLHLDRPQSFGRRKLGMFVKQLRPHQWSKNILIFVPAFAGHQFGLDTLIVGILAFIAFSMMASSIYVVNDLLDLEADRAHPRKRGRPFASGLLSIHSGLIMAPLLALTSISISAAFLPGAFMLILFCYLTLTLAYSLFLKKKIMLDVFVLAALYTTRIIAGGMATQTEMSPWMLGFSVFFFLSLAIIKRIAELVDMIAEDRIETSKRDYIAADLGTIQSLGAASAYSSIVILTLYISSPEATSLYQSPQILWGISPLLLFWISRMLALAGRGHMDDDPIVFAAKDRTSMLVGVCTVLIIASAIFAQA